MTETDSGSAKRSGLENAKAPNGQSRVSSDLLSERVANALREDILAGRIAPGARIRQEDLAQKFEVSRIPVREALRRLESDGLVVLRANSGAWVAKVDLSELIEIYKIRERIEPLAIRESVPNLTADQIEHIAALCDQISAVTNVEDFLRLDREFHLLTYAGAQMKTLRDMIDKFWNTTQHYRRKFTERGSRESMAIVDAQHRLLVGAIRRRDEEEAERVLLGHIRSTRMDLVRRSDESSASDDTDSETAFPTRTRTRPSRRG